MEHPSFAERLAFARVVRLWVTGSYPGNAEIGRAVGRTGQAVTKWTDAAQPPTDYRVHGPLASYLGVPERWLIRGEGEPPRAELWASWRAERTPARVLGAGRPTAADDVRRRSASSPRGAELAKPEVPKPEVPTRAPHHTRINPPPSAKKRRA